MKRKVLAIVLVLVVLMSVCLPAFADNADTCCLKPKDNYKRAVQIVDSANRKFTPASARRSLRSTMT